MAVKYVLAALTLALLSGETGVLASDNANGRFDSPPLTSLFRRVLEVTDGQTPQGQIDLYRRLVAPLPADAARWILDMGQFIEDRRITQQEEKLLGYLRRVNDPLVYLTHPAVLNGVTDNDVKWARRWLPKKGKYHYLDKDLLSLEKRLPIKADVRPRLRQLVAKAKDNFEVRKGLCLIANCGHPPPPFDTDGINTQLLILCRLLEYGISDGDERLAIAAALDYGPLLGISEPSLWQRICEFARHRLDYIAETHRMLQERRINWDPRAYPLQACIGLLWCGNSQIDRESDLAVYFAKRRMTRDEFEQMFTRADTMVEMRNWLIAQGVFSHQANLQQYVQKHSELATYYDSKTSAAAEMSIRLSWQKMLWHPDFRKWDVNWQWRHHKHRGFFTAACRGTGAIGSSLMRCLNISTLQRSHAYWHYIADGDVWRFDSHELMKLVTNGFLEDRWSLPPGVVVYHKIPWDNLHLGLPSVPHAGGTHENIMIFYATKDVRAFVSGIPSGYVFRSSLPCRRPY